MIKTPFATAGVWFVRQPTSVSVCVTKGYYYEHPTILTTFMVPLL